jgi:hypothetical protein
MADPPCGTLDSGKFGISLTSADMDLAGYDDLVVGMIGYDDGDGPGDDGAACIRYDMGAPGVASFTLYGSDSEQAGAALASADFTGGGTGVAVGAPYRDGVGTDDGIVYIVEPGLATVDAPLDLAAAAMISGDGTITHIGQALAGVDDLSGAGLEGLLVCGEYACAWFADASYVTDWSAATATFATDSQLPTVANAGDVDGDDVMDFLVGDPDADYDGVGGGEGAAYLFLSSAPPAGVTDLATAAMIFPGGADGDAMGFAVAGADVNADFKSDIFLAAPGDDWDATAQPGAAYLYYAPFRAIGGGVDLTADASAAIIGETSDDWVGFSVGTVGDVNCDGVADFATGGVFADGAAAYSGVVYIFLGPVAGGSNLSWKDGSGPWLNAGDADVVVYGASSWDGMGNKLIGLGNFDDDPAGCDDFAVAASGGDLGGTDSGSVYVFSGSTALGDSISELYVADAMVTFYGEARATGSASRSTGVATLMATASRISWWARRGATPSRRTAVRPTSSWARRTGRERSTAGVRTASTTVRRRASLPVGAC